MTHEPSALKVTTLPLIEQTLEELLATERETGRPEEAVAVTW